MDKLFESFLRQGLQLAVCGILDCVPESISCPFSRSTKIRLQAVSERRHDLVKGDESVQNHTLRVPALLGVFRSANTRSCCSPTRHVAVPIVQDWRLTRDVFDIGMERSAQVKTASASQWPSQQVYNTQTWSSTYRSFMKHPHIATFRAFASSGVMEPSST